ncbi:hypothetical protein [Sphingomonas mollis]|uniref:Uncharacterized protein n=1 Tax=Sphingomonas mollis TaxID=2795726 RepID=A0ABS0XUP7_9SPHN|nr:hypothetical protein [Sphingomonas sp. BT553]MBJ6123757.1 hypothetical protein [Sphingomonas sp. BT553]
MIPVIIDLPYAMLASLEAAAQSTEIGDIVRAALVAIGHGKPRHSPWPCKRTYRTTCSSGSNPLSARTALIDHY